MKTFLVLLGIGIGLWFWNSRPEQEKVVKNTGPAKAELISFQTQVEPIFKNNCSPCHFPGGKLYDKLPFDKAETIISHEAGILKRIKKEDEVKLIRQFTEQNKVVALK